jgi:hypothetical protein
LQGRRRTQHIGRPGDEPIDDRAEALQFALAIPARNDMGFDRGSLARRQNLQRVGARHLALPAAVQVWARAHTPKNVNRKLLDGSEVVVKDEMSAPAG